MSEIKVEGNISAGGDVVLGDNNKNVARLWVDCSSDELREDFYFRKKLLRDSTFGKWKRMAIGWLVVGCSAGFVAIYFYVAGNSNLSGLIMGGAGMLLALASVKVVDTPTQFEVRQMNSLAEIKMLLKERGERI